MLKMEIDGWHNEIVVMISKGSYTASILAANCNIMLVNKVIKSIITIVAKTRCIIIICFSIITNPLKFIIMSLLFCLWTKTETVFSLGFPDDLLCFESNDKINVHYTRKCIVSL